MNKTVKIFRGGKYMEKAWAFDCLNNIHVTKHGADDPTILIVISKATLKAKYYWVTKKPHIDRIELSGYYDPESFEFFPLPKIIMDVRIIKERP